MRKLLKTPITYDQIKDLRIGDTVYLSGELVTCRDAAILPALVLDLDSIEYEYAGDFTIGLP